MELVNLGFTLAKSLNDRFLNCTGCGARGLLGAARTIMRLASSKTADSNEPDVFQRMELEAQLHKPLPKFVVGMLWGHFNDCHRCGWAGHRSAPAPCSPSAPAPAPHASLCRPARLPPRSFLEFLVCKRWGQEMWQRLKDGDEAVLHLLEDCALDHEMAKVRAAAAGAPPARQQVACWLPLTALLLPRRGAARPSPLTHWPLLPRSRTPAVAPQGAAVPAAVQLGRQLHAHLHLGQPGERAARGQPP